MSFKHYQEDESQRFGRGRKSNSRHWNKQFRIPHEDVMSRGVPILFHPERYLDPRDPLRKRMVPFYPYVEHGVQRLTGKVPVNMGTFLCSAGWDPRAPQPCLGEFFVDHATGAQRKLVTTRSMLAVGVIVLAWFHKVPTLGPNGAYKINDETKEPWYNYELCTAPVCEHCKREHPPSLAEFFRERTFGQVRYLALGRNHWEHLGSIDELAMHKCACSGYISVTELGCPNCMELLLDARAMPERDIESVLATEQTCPHCKTRIAPVARYSCDRCADPRRLSLLPEERTIPAVAWLRREGEGQNSKVSMVDTRAATDFRILDVEQKAEVAALTIREDGSFIWVPRVKELLEHPLPLDRILTIAPGSEPSYIAEVQEPLLRKLEIPFANPWAIQDPVQRYGAQPANAVANETSGAANRSYR